MISLGGIIGTGYFLGAGYVLSATGPSAILSYLFGGFIVFCVMLSLGELAINSCTTGSFIRYAHDHITPAWGCGIGWSYWLSWITYIPSEMIAGGVIMHYMVPSIPASYWTILLGITITIINTAQIGAFGEVEYWLSMIKILGIVMFCSFAVLVGLGVLGDPQVDTIQPIFQSYDSFFPMGATAILLAMPIILVNFQGAEIIGIAAAESENPKRILPQVIKSTVWRIIGLYVIPIMLLVLIFPWRETSPHASPFIQAMEAHGLKRFGVTLSFVILVSAISCTTSGLYTASRTLYNLSLFGMAPKAFSKLNISGVPQRATLASMLICWIIVTFNLFNIGHSFYTTLLALSGFSGALIWISISWAHLCFRKNRVKQDPDGTRQGAFSYKAPLFPYLSHFAIWSQLLALLSLAFNPDLRISLYAGIPLFTIPTLIYYFLCKNRRSNFTSLLESKTLN
jgi:AAT family amino acid transporter